MCEFPLPQNLGALDQKLLSDQQYESVGLVESYEWDAGRKQYKRAAIG